MPEGEGGGVGGGGGDTYEDDPTEWQDLVGGIKE